MLTLFICGRAGTTSRATAARGAVACGEACESTSNMSDPHPPVSMTNAPPTSQSHTNTQENLRFVIIGAGLSGIMSVIALERAGYRNIAIYEKADRVGGTWRENTYPGVGCDVPSHLYCY